MPKRSNAFQRLALLVHQKLEPTWVVTESEMLQDSVTGSLREVDVVAKQLLMGHQLVLSVECRDHVRSADVTWVEAMAKKHEHLPTSKLVLWSRSGFTSAALAKATFLGIDVVSHQDIDKTSWAEMARILVGGHIRHVAPRYSPFIDVHMPDGATKRFEQVDDWIFVDESGKELCSVSQLQAVVANNSELGSVLLDNAPDGEGDFWVEWIPPVDWFLMTPEGEACKAARIGFGVRTDAEMAPTQATSALSGDEVVTLVTAELRKGEIEVVVKESEDHPPEVKASLRPKQKLKPKRGSGEGPSHS